MTLYSAKSSFPAFNGWKLTILLEELKAAGKLEEGFQVRELDLDAMEHKSDWPVRSRGSAGACEGEEARDSGQAVSE